MPMEGACRAHPPAFHRDTVLPLMCRDAEVCMIWRDADAVLKNIGASFKTAI